MPAKTPLAGDKIDAPAACTHCTVPFRLYCGGVVTRTQNVSEYMLVLVVCLVLTIVHWQHSTNWQCCILSVNVRIKFYSIEGATIYDAAYSVNLDLKIF